MKARERKRAAMVAKYAEKRKALKDAEDWEGLQKLPANSSCLLYTSPSPRDVEESRMPSSA